MLAGAALGALGLQLLLHLPLSGGQWKNPPTLHNKITALSATLCHLEQVQVHIGGRPEATGVRLGSFGVKRELVSVYSGLLKNFEGPIKQKEGRVHIFF